MKLSKTQDASGLGYGISPSGLAATQGQDVSPEGGIVTPRPLAPWAALDQFSLGVQPPQVFVLQAVE